MSSRRSFQMGDSLGLLFDTTCNAFGAIVVIAVLVAVVSREVTNEERRSDVPAAIQQRRLENIRSELASAEEFNRKLRSQAAPAEAQERLRLVVKRAELRSAVEREALRLKDKTETIRAQKVQSVTLDPGALIAEVNHESAAVSTSKRETENRISIAVRAQVASESEIRTRERQIQEAKKAMQRSLRLPLEHDSSKRPFWVTLRYGQFYPIDEMDGSTARESTRFVKRQQIDIGRERVDPIPGMGMDPVKDVEAVRRFVASIPKERFYLAIIANEDSFGVASTIREAAIAEGLEYGFGIQKQGEPTVFTTLGGQRPPTL